MFTKNISKIKLLLRLFTPANLSLIILKFSFKQNKYKEIQENKIFIDTIAIFQGLSNWRKIGITYFINFILKWIKIIRGLDIMTEGKLSSIKVANMDIPYCSFSSSSRMGWDWVFLPIIFTS